MDTQLMNIRQTAVPVAAVVLLCLALCFPSWAAAASADEAGFTLTEQSLDNLRQEGLPNEILEKLEALKDQEFNTEDELLEAVRQEIGNDQTVSYEAQILKHAADDISEITRVTEMLQAQNRAIEALQAQNRALAKRLAELEAAQHGRVQKQAKAENQPRKVEVENTDQEQLEQRVKELEVEKTAREEATRSTIREALSTLGSKINESVALGGTIEVVGGWAENFSGQDDSVIRLDTFQLDLEVQVNDWTLGSFIIEYDAGTDATFATTEDFELSVDKINIDTAFLTIGDPQRFPPFVTVGRQIVPFGISTGDPVADVLTDEDPLTIEVFEMREDAILFGVGFPTPPLTPATPPVTPPPVKPLLINPLVSSLMGGLGYSPPPKRPAPPTPITPTPVPPLFNAGFYLFNGDTVSGPGERKFSPSDHFGATVGFRTKGDCGRPYDQLGAEGRWWEVFCPWSIDVDVDYTNSVFDSRFLEFEYQRFLGQIGFVPGMAASVKSTLGPVSLVGEWNGAIDDAKFIDEAPRLVSMRPSAWQISLGYQFDWNPWVEEIGAQGTYLAFGYSESHDLAGVTRSIFGEQTRVGFAPKRRFLVNVSEWVLDGLKFGLEYSHNVDYSKSEGGTGNSANGVFSTFTYVW